MSRFTSIQVGDTAEITHVITERDVEKFVELTGDDNKIHVDSVYAGKTSFKNRVVHGMLGASFISTVIGTKLPGDGALWFAQNLEFLMPVRIGDEITIRAEVTKKVDRDNSIELKTDIVNQHRQLVTTGTAKVKVIEQEAMRETRPQRKKVALIIGATGGIGKAIAIQLAKDGFDIAVHYSLNEQAAVKIQESIVLLGRRAKTFKADITDERQVTSLVEGVVRAFDTVSVLVNCATAKTPNIKFASLQWKDMLLHWDINIKGAFSIAKALVPLFELQQYGKIIHITTHYTEGTPPPELAAYVTAKSALNGFTRALAVELAPKGITVNSISPGMTETGLIGDVPEKTRLVTAARTPMRRLAHPEDVAGAASFLASDKADYITGETIRVNGGQIML